LRLLVVLAIQTLWQITVKKEPAFAEDEELRKAEEALQMA